MADRIEQQLAFVDEIARLEAVYRRNRSADPARCESSAEHSWHVALMAAILLEHAEAPRLDLLKVVKMLLVHDLVEIDAGDTWLYDEAARRDQAAREERAAARLFGMLPPDQGAELHALWKEFEAGHTPEAAFAASIDALQPLANHLRHGDPAAEPRPAEREVVERKRHIARGSEGLWRVAQRLIEESARKGLYRRYE